MIEANIDLTDPDKARKFIRWARENKIKYSLFVTGYVIPVQFNNEFEVLMWV